jgi:hypothetical protein
MTPNDWGFFGVLALMFLLVLTAIGVAGQEDSDLVCRHAIQRNFAMSREDVEKLLRDQREWEKR